MINIDKREHLLRRKVKLQNPALINRFATINYKDDIDKFLQANSCKFPLIKHSRIMPMNPSQN